MLAKLKGLRGTALDMFGRTEERRTERALIGEYRASIEEVLRRARARPTSRWRSRSRASRSRSAATATSRSATSPRRGRSWDALMAKWRDPQAAARPPERCQSAAGRPPDAPRGIRLAAVAGAAYNAGLLRGRAACMPAALPRRAPRTPFAPAL